MSKSIFDYDGEKKTTKKEGFSETSSMNEEQKKTLQDRVNKYNGLSEDQLLSELYGEVAKKKQDGTFDYNELQQMSSKLMPYLSQSQQNMLAELIKNLR